MNIEQFAQRQIALFPQFIKVLVRYEHNDLTRGKITLPQFWVLEYLSHQEKCKMNVLANHLGISPAATTGLIDRLINQVLVTRKSDLEDRRIVWIGLTSKGKDVISVIRRQKIKALIKIFGKLPAEDRSHYLNVMEKIAKDNNS